MFREWIAQRGGTTTRALAALVVVGACFGAVALAASQPRGKGEGPRPAGPPPSRPKIVKHPARLSSKSKASFTFTAAQEDLRFRCRLDRDGWQACETPAVFTGIEPGQHSFMVRAVSRRGRYGPAAGYRWTRFAPRQFAIEPRFSGIGALYPGAAATGLPVLLRNPNPVPILVTALRVGVSADPAGCPSNPNLELVAASASKAAPLRLAAGASLSLPSGTATAPAIALRDLDVNQDACQGATFPLVFSGEAHG
jgi:hypothetical protein